jgi:molybdate transport system substrate-binding protein
MLRRLPFLLVLLACGTAAAADRVLTVFAAASLTNVLQDVGAAFTTQTQVPVRFSFAGSSALARQIESGSPADVFVSADREWMDYLEARGLIAPTTRVDVVSNALVLIAPADSALRLRIAPGMDLTAALGPGGRVATGDPSSVPVGRYAQAALTRLRAWDQVARRIVAADNVRTALNFVARGEAPLGIVYATDARSEPRVKVLDSFPTDSHEPITYPAATTAGARAEAAQFVRYLGSPGARALFKAAGFGLRPLPPPAAASRPRELQRDR